MSYLKGGRNVEVLEPMPDLETTVQSHMERLAEHEKRLNGHSERLNHHEKRLDGDKMDIQELRAYDQKKHERLLDLEENYKRLEKTVATENEQTRKTMREQTEKLFDIVDKAMGYQETRTVQTHELKMARLNTWSTVFLKVSTGLVGLLTSGSALYYIILYFLDK